MNTKTLLLVSLIILSAPAPLFAQTPTPGPKLNQWRREVREERQEMLKDLKEVGKQARQDAREARQEARELRLTTPPAGTTTPSPKKAKFQARLTQVYQNILSQAEARYASLLASKTKIQTRLNEAKAAGKRTTEAEAKLATFSTAQYTANLAAFKAEYAKLAASSNPGLELGSLRSAGSKVARDLNQMRQVLSDTLKLLINANKK